MIKRLELTDQKSCMSRADDNEMTFVLLGRDIAAPATIRFWVSERIKSGKNKLDDPQIVEALSCADTIEADQLWKKKNNRRQELAEKKSIGTITTDELNEFTNLQNDYFAYLEMRFPRPERIKLPE